MGRIETAFAAHRLHPGKGDLTPLDFSGVLQNNHRRASHQFHRIVLSIFIYVVQHSFIVSEGLLCLSVASGPL